MLNNIYNSAPPVTVILISLAIIMFVGFFITQITRALKLPDVTGYLFSGILIGPFVLNLIPSDIVVGMDFISDIAIGLIAFGVGKYLVFQKNDKNRYKIFVVATIEFVLTFILMFVALYYIFGLAFDFSFLLSIIACATAPTSTIMTIRQYKAKGEFVNSLLKVIAFDNAIAITLFHISLEFFKNTNHSAVTFMAILIPVLQNLALIGFGIIMGIVVAFVLKNLKKSGTKQLFVGLIAILTIVSVCSYFLISPLLSCMAFGTAFINVKGEEDLFENLNRFSPPIVLIFFVVSGIKFNVASILSIGVIGIVYIIIRAFGKIFGTYVGGVITKSPTNVQRYLGYALIPQASVAISLATVATRAIQSDMINNLSVIILSTAFLYELVGPLAAKHSLFKSKSVDKKHLKNPKCKPYPIEEYAIQSLDIINLLDENSINDIHTHNEPDNTVQENDINKNIKNNITNKTSNDDTDINNIDN